MTDGRGSRRRGVLGAARGPRLRCRRDRLWFIDENSRIQVLDSTQPLLPMRPGQVKRHGIISRRRV
jgi:hypothetical protein